MAMVMAKTTSHNMYGKGKHGLESPSANRARPRKKIKANFTSLNNHGTHKKAYASTSKRKKNAKLY